MSPLLVAVLAWAVSGAEAAPATVPSSIASAPSLAGSELRDAIHQSLRRWARPTAPQADEAAQEFLALYDQLQRDEQLATSQREYLETKLRFRLLQLSDQISVRVARQERRPEGRGPKTVTIPEGKGGPLAQQMGAMGPQGGPGAFGNPGPSDDYGPALVDLIQKTVRPASWDINGGPGSIYYWYPGRALVVRQMDQVHDDLGGLLQQLQRAGR